MKWLINLLIVVTMAVLPVTANSASLSLGEPYRITGTDGWYVPVVISNPNRDDIMAIEGWPNGNLLFTGSLRPDLTWDVALHGGFWEVAVSAISGTHPLYRLIVMDVNGDNCLPDTTQGVAVAIHVFGEGTVGFLDAPDTYGLSCMSQFHFTSVGTPVTVPPALSVPIPRREPITREMWFDLQGRELPSKPTQRGLYFHRDKNGTTTKKVVML